MNILNIHMFYNILIQVVQRQIDLLLKGKQQSGSADQSLKFEDFVDLMTTFFVNREKMTSAKEGREVSIVDVEEVPEKQVEANIEEEHVDSNSNQVDFDLLAQVSIQYIYMYICKNIIYFDDAHS